MTHVKNYRFLLFFAQYPSSTNHIPIPYDIRPLSRTGCCVCNDSLSDSHISVTAWALLWIYLLLNINIMSPDFAKDRARSFPSNEVFNDYSLILITKDQSRLIKIILKNSLCSIASDNHCQTVECYRGVTVTSNVQMTCKFPFIILITSNYCWFQIWAIILFRISTNQIKRITWRSNGIICYS